MEDNITYTQGETAETVCGDEQSDSEITPTTQKQDARKETAVHTRRLRSSPRTPTAKHATAAKKGAGAIGHSGKKETVTPRTMSIDMTGTKRKEFAPRGKYICLQSRIHLLIAKIATSSTTKGAKRQRLLEHLQELED